jgi:hypothetical protein
MLPDSLVKRKQRKVTSRRSLACDLYRNEGMAGFSDRKRFSVLHRIFYRKSAAAIRMEQA